MASACIRRRSSRPITPMSRSASHTVSPCGFGVATKLGFKMPKWITSIEVTNEYPGGYWEDRDYNWFSGL